MSRLKGLFFLPSFYGFCSLLITYLIFILDVIDYNPISVLTHVIIIGSILSFLFSTICYLYIYRNTLENYKVNSNRISTKLLLLLYLIGFLGSYLYLKEFFNYYGGYLNYLLVLFSENSSELRSNGQIASESVGIQLTYFGWIAIGITIFQITNTGASKWWWFPLIILFLTNLLFIDRTRPTWIIISALYILLVSFHHRMMLSSLIKRVFFSFNVFLGIFLLMGLLSGKTTDEKLYRGWNISPNSQNIVFYLTSSYVYLDYIICYEKPTYTLDRTVYPFLKTLKKLNISNKEPAPQVNEFKGMPYLTNVGTFLEPFYRDFGLLFIFLSIIIHSVVLNQVAIYLLKYNSSYSIFLASNLCIVNLFSFFTPKINNTQIWLFFIIFLMILIIKLFRSKDES